MSDYENKTAKELREAALKNDVQAIEVITDLFNDVFYRGDPFYPGNSAEGVPKVNLDENASKLPVAAESLIL